MLFFLFSQAGIKQRSGLHGQRAAMGPLRQSLVVESFEILPDRYLRRMKARSKVFH
jgi:hypothetical protein